MINQNGIRMVVKYLRHQLVAGNEHSVHSPFVFKLLTEGIYKKDHPLELATIENIRKKLLSDEREINVIDLGAGSTFDGKSKKRLVKAIAANFAKSKRYCKLLYHLTEFLKPSVMIELGTSLGISAMYQSAGNPNGKLYTLEGCPSTALVAIENFKKNNFNTIKCVTGNFNDTLPILLNEIKKVDYIFIDGNHTYEATIRYFKLLKNHIDENSVIIFDDINWSEGMQQAWSEIKSDPDITITLDFFFLGVVFFNKAFTKQNFLLKI